MPRTHYPPPALTIALIVLLLYLLFVLLVLGTLPRPTPKPVQGLRLRLQTGMLDALSLEGQLLPWTLLVLWRLRIHGLSPRYVEVDVEDHSGERLPAVTHERAALRTIPVPLARAAAACWRRWEDLDAVEFWATARETAGLFLRLPGVSVPSEITVSYDFSGVHTAELVVKYVRDFERTKLTTPRARVFLAPAALHPALESIDQCSAQFIPVDAKGIPVGPLDAMVSLASAHSLLTAGGHFGSWGLLLNPLLDAYTTHMPIPARAPVCFLPVWSPGP